MVDVFIDTETTGLGHVASPPRDDAVVEVGIACRLGGEVKKWSTFVKQPPRFFADGRADKALEINRISPGEIAAAPSQEFAFGMLARALESLKATRLVAFNAKFDQPFMEACPEFKSWLDRSGIAWSCAQQRAKLVVLVPGHLSLKTACSKLGIGMEFGSTHRASYDAYLAMLVWEECDRLGVLAG